MNSTTTTNKENNMTHTSRIPLTARPATERLMNRNGFGTTGEAICHCCGEETPDQWTFGIMYAGQMHWSASYCSHDCHDEMCDIETPDDLITWEAAS